MIDLINMKYFDDYYVIISIIGNGYNSTIYKVYNKISLDYYACKKITILDNNYEQIKNEIDILQVLQFDNDFIKLYEYFVDEFNYYLIFELADGDLTTYFDKNILYENDVKLIFLKILNAIKKLHQINIFHLDIKPNNILYVIKNNEIQIKIADFGNSVWNFNLNSNLYPNIIKNNLLTFTPEYVAPEFLNIICNKNDIYSLGYMLYKLMMEKISYTFVVNNKISLYKFNKDLCEFHENWNKISYDVRDLIKLMINNNFESRPDIYKCLNHQWFKNMYA